MATRCGSVRPPLLPSAPSAPPPPPSSSSVRPVVFLSGHGNGGASMMGPAGGKRTPASRVPSTQAKAYTVLAEVDVQTKNKGSAALLALVAGAATAVPGVLKAIGAGRRRWPREAERVLESAIINCRFFTLIGVAGTLVGSILCFVEGCSLILEAYLEYFHALWEKLDQAEVMSLLIESMDMFLIGSAMLNFGMGLYIMFVGCSRGPKKCIGRLLPRVALSLHRKILPPAMQKTQYISEAKAKLGHAVLTLLQSGVVDKLKGVPVESGLDLACFAGAVLVSSAGIFLLSRLQYTTKPTPSGT